MDAIGPYSLCEHFEGFDLPLARCGVAELHQRVGVGLVLDRIEIVAKRKKAGATSQSCDQGMLFVGIVTGLPRVGLVIDVRILHRFRGETAGAKTIGDDDGVDIGRPLDRVADRRVGPGDPEAIGVIPDDD